MTALRTLTPDQPDSLLAPVAAALQGVNARLSFDTSQLTQRLPAALSVMRDAVASASLAFVRSIESAYTEARNFLENSALAREVGAGRSLQEVALGVVSDILARLRNGSCIWPAT